MRIRSLVALTLLAACGGGESALPGVTAPSTPPITQPGAADLVPVGPTSFAATPGGTIVLTVRALRPDGGPANGVPVVFKVQAGAGVLQPVVTSTNEQGFASAKWTLGPTAAVNLATATALLAPTPVSFTVSTFPADGTTSP
jgi:hypothetical protein